MVGKNDPREQYSVCWNVWQLGWVSAEDYYDDTEASGMWPDSIRNLYYKISPAAVRKGHATQWGKALFFVNAYWYIHVINGVDAVREWRWEAWKLLAWVPFLIWSGPALGAALILTYTE